jgi:hypothetical protein
VRGEAGATDACVHVAKRALFHSLLSRLHLLDFSGCDHFYFAFTLTRTLVCGEASTFRVSIHFAVRTRERVLIFRQALLARTLVRAKSGAFHGLVCVAIRTR